MTAVTALLKKQLGSDEGSLDFLIMRPTGFINNSLADFETTLDFLISISGKFDKHEHISKNTKLRT